MQTLAAPFSAGPMPFFPATCSTKLLNHLRADSIIVIGCNNLLSSGVLSFGRLVTSTTCSYLRSACLCNISLPLFGLL